MFPKIFGNAGDETQLPSKGDTSITSDEASPEVGETSADLSEIASSGPTKMSQATDIYRRMTRKKGTTRKEIVATFMEEVGLTKAGAATYYQMIKNGRR